ncbi:MAG: lipoyl(octanoyl) transferase LipB [Bacteroidales bacterium]|nr:lipoyl(octanoyl) transferase LipB [Bacteroidales bacterium]
MNELNFIDWGQIDYSKALELQTKMFNEKVLKKLNLEKDIPQDFIVCEHSNVYTIGKHGKDKNLLIDEKFLNKIGAEVFHINRGGDITYHGQGQITGYPIIDLDALNLGVREYIFLIEQMIIDVMGEYGIVCERLKGATGVWLDSHSSKARKICAIGVKVSRGITMHGYALNVNTDLNYFNYINPCGFVDKGVTSMQKELDRELDIQQVKRQLYEKFLELINK